MANKSNMSAKATALQSKFEARYAPQQGNAGLRRIFGLVNGLTAIIVLLTVCLVYLVHSYHPMGTYHAEISDGRRMRLVALDQPNINKEALLSWVGGVTAQVLTFGFNDYEKKLSANVNHFTPAGWKAFVPGMMGSLLFKGMLESDQLLTAIPIGKGDIVWEGVEKGIYTWVILQKVNITVRAGDVSDPSNYTVRLQVARVPTSINPMGIAIDSFTVR